MGRRKTKRATTEEDLREALERMPSFLGPERPESLATRVEPEGDDDFDDEPGYYTIRPWADKLVIDYDGEEDFIDEYKGTILHRDGPRARERAGQFRAYLVRVRDAEAAGESSLELFDAHSQTLAEYFGALFDVRSGELKGSVVGEFGGWQPNVLILDMIQVLPAHRGRGLGLAVASKLIDLLAGSCAVVACKPFPLQFNEGRWSDPRFQEGMRLEEFPTNEAAAYRKIRRYWGKLGFRRIGRTEFFAFSTSEARPDIEDICDTRKL